MNEAWELLRTYWRPEISLEMPRWGQEMWGIVLGMAILLFWVLWMIARKIVRFGFFLFSFAIALGMSWLVLGFLAEDPVPWWVWIPSALLMAWCWSVLRSRAARWVSTMLLLGLLKTALLLAPEWAPLVPWEKLPGGAPEEPASSPPAWRERLQRELEERGLASGSSEEGVSKPVPKEGR